KRVNLLRKQAPVIGPLTLRFASVDQFQRKLDLPRRSGGAADDAKSAAEHGVRRQAEIHNVKYVEKFCAKLEHAQFTAASFSKRCVLDQSHVEIVKAGTTERVAAQCAKNPLIRARSAGDVDGNKKEGAVVCATPEIIFPDRAARREIRHRNQIRAIRPAGSKSCLLYSRINRKGRPGRQRGDIQKLPTFCKAGAQWLKETNAIKRQRLEQTDRENMRHVESRWPFFGAGIQRILRQSLQRHAWQA